MSNGERFVFNVNFTGIEQPDWGEALGLIHDQWAEIGVDLNSSSIERSIYHARGEANEHDFMVWGAPGGLDPTLSPRDVVAIHPQGSWFAIPWARWYLTDGAEGEEPTESMQRRLELYDAFRQEADQDRALAIFREIHAEAADAFEIIGITLTPNLIGVRNIHLRNVPDSIPASWMYPDPGPTLPQTYYYAD